MKTQANATSPRPGTLSGTTTGDPFAEHPFFVFWEITRANALACSHYRAEVQTRRAPRELNQMEAAHIVDQLAALKPPMLVLTSGDPMMCPDTLDIAARASASGQRVALSPSATPRPMRSDFHAIRAAGIERISLSLDGATRETHDAFRRVPGTFVKVTPFSQIWEGNNRESAAVLEEIRSISQLSTSARQSLIQGRCADCRWFNICGGGFRTRAATECKHVWGSDPGGYLTDPEIHASQLLPA